MKKTNVYLMQLESGGPLKIGKANDVKKRLQCHQSSHWQKLHIILIIKDCSPLLERAMKNHYIQYNIMGEWFDSYIINLISSFLERGWEGTVCHLNRCKRRDDRYLF